MCAILSIQLFLILVYGERDLNARGFSAILVIIAISVCIISFSIYSIVDYNGTLPHFPTTQ